MNDAELDNAPLENWLLHAGLQGFSVAALLEGFCRRLRHEGMALVRGHIALAALHPLVRARSLTWKCGDSALVGEEMPHRDREEDAPGWFASPFRHMLVADIPQLRRRLAGAGAVLDFPVLHEFAGLGYTEWLARAFGFGWEMEHLPVAGKMAEIGMACSFCTDAPDGFPAADLARLDALLPQLALAVKATTMVDTTRNVMAAYLGGDAAQHVLSGEIRRGKAQRVAAAILYADLRGFTALADRLEIEPLVATLNAYFDCLGPAVAERGGQVLKFLGDGLLASFQIEDEADPAPYCRAALSAAEAALAAVAKLNAERAAAGAPVLQLDIALHLGTLMYGNVGTADRLDFTLIGPAVNEAARIENLCSMLDRALLASGSFAACAGGGLRSLGHHSLRGVAEPREVFGL
ncbi:adenylate/guanylate cyclase domain-containing protein [Ferrovibrio sp.]|uniref:adenylate/guanylate cyclase domain-containing protein n=1 Tax=Ferrovibrio sp. TaxID=1917215 RepID=UPI001B7CA0B5|nr:adenylate/guanylate cyclase domain-containing protein [Ferrovibrio sp.]MBP7065251.1 adenylate/guanylate cyclase domain-containing protein [Ferrovibrio sp.]